MTTDCVLEVEGRHYGPFDVPRPLDRATNGEQDSLAYICPHCGKVWARLIVPGQRWFAVHRSCPLHPSWDGDPPGSVILPYWAPLLDCLPPERIREEFSIHLNHYQAQSWPHYTS